MPADKFRLFTHLQAGSLFILFAFNAYGETTKLVVRGNIIHAELATTERARSDGLMYRENLCGNCGMLFVFPSADKWAFWSKNTFLALSVAFIADTGKIVQIIDMEPESERVHTSDFDVVYALEMPQGWFARHGVERGDRLDGIGLK